MGAVVPNGELFVVLGLGYGGLTPGVPDVGGAVPCEVEVEYIDELLAVTGDDGTELVAPYGTVPEEAGV